MNSRNNPALALYRDVVNELPEQDIADELRWWLKCFEEPETLIPDNGYEWSNEDIDHARKVLSRLARLRNNR